MTAYVIADIEVTDPVGYEAYKKLTPASLAAYGGKFLVRGGTVDALEGKWSPKRLVVLEFESLAQAKRWWNSPEYAPAKPIRVRCAKTNMIAVEGV